MKFGELRIKQRSFSFGLLKALAIGGATLVAASNKRFWFDLYLNLNKELNKYKKQKEKFKAYQALRYLRQKKLVDIIDKPNGLLIKINTRGYEVLEFYESIEKMALKKPKQWDRKFRFVIFDIPAKKQNSRIVLIQKLKELGFYMFQKSVWVHPYDCVNEIVTLRKLFEIEPYVKILVADAVEDQYNLTKHFELYK